jgi:hypothetical protein
MKPNGDNGHLPYGGFCQIHVRAYLPPTDLRRTPFICVKCDREVDPTKEQWTSMEFYLK